MVVDAGGTTDPAQRSMTAAEGGDAAAPIGGRETMPRLIEDTPIVGGGIGGKTHAYTVRKESVGVSLLHAPFGIMTDYSGFFSSAHMWRMR